VARPSQQDENGLIPQSAGEQAAAAANKDSLSNLGVWDNDGQRHLLAEVPAATNSVPIRIWVEYQGLSRLQQDLQKDLLNTVNIALGVLAKYFKVRKPRAGRLQVKPVCTTSDNRGVCYSHSPDFLGAAQGDSNYCGAALINSSHIATYRQCDTLSFSGGNCVSYPGGTGEYTDYYLYITTQQDEHCDSGAVAWALPCLYDVETNRPLLGSANICPEIFVKKNEDAAVSVLVHELMHSLGFTDDMFNKFIDADGAAIPKEKVVKEVMDANGRRANLVITPTVQKEVRAQFGCETLEGAALENEGGTGSADAHWEYRWFQGELMVATNLFAVYGKPATMSRITLAFMQDTGWFDVNWDQAGFLDWGYGAGCDFVGMTCDQYVSANPAQKYFCSPDDYKATTDSVCTFDGLARAKCENAQFADGCVMKMAMASAPNCLWNKYGTNDGDKFGWGNGLTSRCSPVTWLFNNYAYQFPDTTYKQGWMAAMCFKASCTAAGALQYNILGNQVACPTGKTVNLAEQLPTKFKEGSIGPCPDNAAMCSSLSCNDTCAVGGYCHAGTCHCNLMYQGKDCEKRLTADGKYTNYDPLPGDVAAEPDTGADSSYLVMTCRLSNRQEQLYVGLDKFKSAVAQLAGVSNSRVAVLSYSMNTPASSIIGGRRLTSTEPQQQLAIDGGMGAGRAVLSSSIFEEQQQQQQEKWFLRRLSQADGMVEVYSRIATMNDKDAQAITDKVNNATRQDTFANTLKEAGLNLVPGSISIQQPDQGMGVLGPIQSALGNSKTREIIIIVGACVGAALVMAIIVCLIVRCVRSQLRPRGAPVMSPRLQPVYGSRSGGINPIYGAPVAPPPGMNGFMSQPPRAAYGSSQSGGAAGPQGYPSVGGGGYVVQGRSFRTRQEAEDYQLALALQRSIQQTSSRQASPRQGAGGTPTYVPAGYGYGYTGSTSNMASPRR